jgi:hypothetical protein
VPRSRARPALRIGERTAAGVRTSGKPRPGGVRFLPARLLRHREAMIRRAIVVSLLCLPLAVASRARAQAGSGLLTGRSVLAVKGCGRQRAAFAVAVVTDAAGTWRAQDSEGRQFAGTWTPKGARGRKLDVAFDSGSEAGFVAVVVSDVAQLCEAPGPITVTSAAKKAFTLAANRKRTRAALVLRYAVTGSVAGRSGTARYLVTAKGPWTPASASVSAAR